MKPYLIAILAAIGLTICACGSQPAPAPTNTVTVTAQPSAPAATPQTSTPTVTSSSPAAAVPAGCLTRYLAASTGLSQGTAGSVFVVIRFKNLNNVPCTLYGFPGVAQAKGLPIKNIGQPSTEDKSTARELVTLQPGGFANSTLKIADAGNFPMADCTPLTVHWLAVIPPNQTVPLFIHYTTVACKAGSAKLLQVTAVRPGNGG
jgi:hypothetical protein